jgi:hypothetical protein
MEGLLTHVATADCFITQPHPALQCGIVAAWWRCHEEGDTAMRRDEQKRRQDQERG